LFPVGQIGKIINQGSHSLRNINIIIGPRHWSYSLSVPKPGDDRPRSRRHQSGITPTLGLAIPGQKPVRRGQSAIDRRTGGAMPARRAAASPRGHPSMRVLEASTPYSSTPEARRAGFISGGRCGPYRGPAGTRSCRFVNLSFPIFIFSGILADTDEGTMRPSLRIFETGGRKKATWA
jgi:hypothetical protein